MSGQGLKRVRFGQNEVTLSTDSVRSAGAFRMNRWQYKNKDAFEPSQAGLNVARVFEAVFVIIGITCFVIAITKL
jgi:hypothetical protein